VKISRFSKSILAILLALSLVFAMAPLTVFAESSDSGLSVTHAIKVEKQLSANSDTPSTDATFAFILEPGSEGTPMPSGSQGSATATITGTGTTTFGDITYTSTGVYYYTVTEEKGTLSTYTYDTTVYTVVVIVENVYDNGSFVYKVTEKAYKNGDTNAKAKDVIFTNKYTAPTPYVTPAPTPSESESPSEPESSEPTNSVETPSEPEEDTGSKTETPGTPIPDTSESSETNSPSDSDEPTYTGTSTSEVPNSEAETPVSQDTTSSVPSSTVPLSVSAPVTGNSTTPKTGDSSQVILWVALAAGSGIVLLFGFFLILRKRK
jgi:pilin isopeptide linkage protein